ncbi:MAG TPA: M56 family metallopeptidase [Thermoanaerobaculia bacterium]|nr:M56 family metallopeptidase [Thermoanaerobaculia bacterium]
MEIFHHLGDLQPAILRVLANPFANELVGPAIAWLLTYLLHGTVLLGLAWLVSKPLARWSVSAEETVWKLALVGALFTASLQLAAGWEPVSGRWGLADLTPPAHRMAAAASDVPAPVRARPIPESARPVLIATAPAPIARLSRPSAPALAFGFWVLGACLLLAGYGRSHALLRRRLKNRPLIVGGTLHSQLRALTVEAGFTKDVRLSCSSRVPVPLALGVRRSEICVPPRALAGLTDEQQEGMLAHELAHLARRDPLWLVVSHVLTCVFFFQPLNWVARRRLREISEMLSDEWAVCRTGRPLSLAGCLAEVAGWSAVRRSLPVPGMVDRPSHLARRIRRLLDGRSPEKPARRLWLAAAMGVLLIVVAAAAPAVSAAGQEASGQPGRPAVNVVQVIPKVTVVAQPKDHPVAVPVDDVDVVVHPNDPKVGAVTDSPASEKAALPYKDVPLEGIADVQVLPKEEQKKMAPEPSDKVPQDLMKPTEEQREGKKDQKESDKEKPPKMVLQLDLWGNFRLVPEKPGC